MWNRVAEQLRAGSRHLGAIRAHHREDNNRTVSPNTVGFGVEIRRQEASGRVDRGEASHWREWKSGQWEISGRLRLNCPRHPGRSPSRRLVHASIKTPYQPKTTSTQASAPPMPLGYISTFKPSLRDKAGTRLGKQVRWNHSHEAYMYPRQEAYSALIHIP